MVFSRFCHLFQREEKIALYNSLNHELRFYDCSSWGELEITIKGFSPDHVGMTDLATQIDDLKEAEFLIDAEVDDENKIQQMREELTTPCINILYLLLAEGCNLACRYCFFENNFSTHPPTNPMPWSLAQQAIDFYSATLCRIDPLRLDRKTKLINFYGGEPLLNRRVFERAVLYVEELMGQGKLPEDTRLSLNTNGTVMSQKLAKFIADHRVEVGVSIDGPQAIHDRDRRTVSGQGTFDKAVRAFKLLQDAGANVGVSCTISEATVDQMPETFRWLVEELGVTGMGFNPLIECSSFKVADTNYAEKVAQNLILCYQFARENNVYEDRMMRKVRVFVGSHFYDRDCSAVGRQIVFGPNGTVGICPTYYASGKYFVKFTSDFDPLSHPIWLEWLQRMPINMPQCLDCSALGICGGGCPYNADIRNGSIWAVDDFFCEHSKVTLEWLIWDLFDAMA